MLKSNKLLLMLTPLILSLSKQLDQAKRRVPTATTKTIIEYIDTSSDVLKECAIEITTVARAADAHAADAKRLSDAWPE